MARPRGGTPGRPERPAERGRFPIPRGPRTRGAPGAPGLLQGPQERRSRVLSARQRRNRVEGERTPASSRAMSPYQVSRGGAGNGTQREPVSEHLAMGRVALRREAPRDHGLLAARQVPKAPWRRL